MGYYPSLFVYVVIVGLILVLSALKKDSNSRQRLFWGLGVLLTSVVAFIIYLFVLTAAWN